MTRFELQTVPYYSLELTVSIHGWVHLEPYRWDTKAGRLSRIEYFPESGRAAVLTVRQTAPRRLEVSASRRLRKAERAAAEARLARALQTRVRTSEALKTAREQDPGVARLLRQGAGRLLRGTSLFEDCIKTLCTTNASWSFTQQMVRNLIRHYGTDGAFPAPPALARASEPEIRRRVRMGYRAASLRKLVRLFLQADSEDEILRGPTPGLGPYGSTHLRVLEGDYRRIPIDSEVRAHCRETHGCETDEQIQKRFEPWGRFVFLGYKLGRQAARKNWIGSAARPRAAAARAS